MSAPNHQPPRANAAETDPPMPIGPDGIPILINPEADTHMTVACPKCAEKVAVPIAFEVKGGDVALTPDLSSLLAHDETCYPPCANHHPVQHRDRKPPWCNTCGWSSPTPAVPAAHLGNPKRVSR